MKVTRSMKDKGQFRYKKLQKDMEFVGESNNKIDLVPGGSREVQAIIMGDRKYTGSAVTLPKMAAYDGASLGRCQTCGILLLKINLVYCLCHPGRATPPEER